MHCLRPGGWSGACLAAIPCNGPVVPLVLHAKYCLQALVHAICKLHACFQVCNAKQMTKHSTMSHVVPSCGGAEVVILLTVATGPSPAMLTADAAILYGLFVLQYDAAILDPALSLTESECIARAKNYTLTQANVKGTAPANVWSYCSTAICNYTYANGTSASFVSPCAGKHPASICQMGYSFAVDSNKYMEPAMLTGIGSGTAGELLQYHSHHKSVCVNLFVCADGTARPSNAVPCMGFWSVCAASCMQLVQCAVQGSGTHASCWSIQ